MKINMKNSEEKGSRSDSVTSLNGNLKIRIAVLGKHDVGKSAFTVRYLTKRYIGEYKSSTDMLYQQTMKIGQTSIDIEIVDISTTAASTTSESKKKSVPAEEFQRVDGFLIIYSITDRSTFSFAQEALETITSHCNQNYSTTTSSGNSSSTSSSGSSSRSSSPTSSPQPRATCPILLVANKKDLEHLRVVEKVEGLSTSMQYGCNFCEVSVAENSPEIYTSFQNLISAFITQNKEPSKRKFSVSKLLSSLRRGRSSSPHRVVTSQASVVDTDILFSSYESSETIPTAMNSPTKTVPAAPSSLPDATSAPNLNSSLCHLKSKLVELHSIKKRNNSPSPPICSL